MTTAVKLFLKQSVLARSIPFELKLDSDYENELEDGDHICTRNIDEYNEVTQKAFKESISKYKNEGITKSPAIGKIKKSKRASFFVVDNIQPLRQRYRPDRQKGLFLKKSSAIMAHVRDVSVNVRQFRFLKKKMETKNEKIIGNRIFSSGSGCIVFRYCWMAKFGCQPLVAHSSRFVPLFHSRKLFEKRL